MKAGIERPTQVNLNKASAWLKDNDFNSLRTNKKRGFLVKVMREF